MNIETLNLAMQEKVEALEQDKNFKHRPRPLSPSQKWTKKWMSQIKGVWWDAEIISVQFHLGHGGDAGSYTGRIGVIDTDVEAGFCATYPHLDPSSYEQVLYSPLHADDLKNIAGDPPSVGVEMAVKLDLDWSGEEIIVDSIRCRGGSC